MLITQFKIRSGLHAARVDDLVAFTDPFVACFDKENSLDICYALPVAGRLVFLDCGGFIGAHAVLLPCCFGAGDGGDFSVRGGAAYVGCETGGCYRSDAAFYGLEA